MGWDTLPALPSFEKARRREIYKKLAAAVKGSPDIDELPSLAEVRKRLRLFDQRYVGIEPIAVERIVGTVDRRTDFGRGFLPKDFDTRERWRRVEQAFPESDFPPIVVYRVDEIYFVVDGHHRVAIAKMREIEYIDAEVTELASRYPIGPEVDIADMIHHEQQRIFMEESGLARSRPEAVVDFSRSNGYIELLDLVKVFGYHLMIENHQLKLPDEIAGRWYDDVYLPALQEMKAEGLQEAFPDATEADLFLWVYQRRQSFFPEHGGLTIREVARRLRDA